MKNIKETEKLKKEILEKVFSKDIKINYPVGEINFGNQIKKRKEKVKFK